MTPALIESLIPILIPIVSVLAGVGLVLGLKYLRLKEKELALESEARHWAEKQHAALEARVDRLENVLLALDADVREKLGLGRDPAREASSLMEGLATPASGEAGDLAGVVRARIR